VRSSPGGIRSSFLDRLWTRRSNAAGGASAATRSLGLGGPHRSWTQAAENGLVIRNSATITTARTK
jgi:hypothetical protein